MLLEFMSENTDCISSFDCHRESTSTLDIIDVILGDFRSIHDLPSTPDEKPCWRQSSRKRQRIHHCSVTAECSSFLSSENAAWNSLLPMGETVPNDLIMQSARFLGLDDGIEMRASSEIIPWTEVVIIHESSTDSQKQIFAIEPSCQPQTRSEKSNLHRRTFRRRSNLVSPVK